MKSTVVPKGLAPSPIETLILQLTKHEAERLLDIIGEYERLAAFKCPTSVAATTHILEFLERFDNAQ